MKTNEPGMVIALDLGGTWIKGTALPAEATGPDRVRVQRHENPLAAHADGESYARFMVDLCRDLARGAPVRAVVASTAGEVDALGRAYRVAGRHLGVMANTNWRETAASLLECPLLLINDAEAFLLGWAEAGALPVNRTAGALVIGTGVGFSVSRHGRWWRPARSLNFLGCVHAESGSYDTWASAVAAAERAGGDLARLWKDPALSTQRADYLHRLARVSATATALYRLDDVVIGGGLADSASTAGFDLGTALSEQLPALLPPHLAPPCVHVARGGNQLILNGTLALGRGLMAGERIRFQGPFDALSTEQAERPEPLEACSTEQIVARLAEAEATAAHDFCSHAAALAPLADRLADVLSHGGRVIYVGAGTSGRLAALDAVELPCTFGLPADQVLAVVAGGVADAALTIESAGEEDASAVPDLLLLQPTPRDAVVGISASGTAYFVRSALAFARQRGATTLLVHEAPVEPAMNAILDGSCSLHSGPEVLPGSTRMKAGTATKKILNILSTTAMVRMGHVREGMMVNVACSNEKLRQRATRMLARLANVPPQTAQAALAAHGYRLRDALRSLAP